MAFIVSSFAVAVHTAASSPHCKRSRHRLVSGPYKDTDKHASLRHYIDGALDIVPQEDRKLVIHVQVTITHTPHLKPISCLEYKYNLS